MSSIPNYFTTLWDNAIKAEAQQKDSRLMGAVMSKGTITGDSFTINGLADDGSLLNENTTRLGDTEWSTEDHTVRQVFMRDFYQAVPLDRADIPKMIVNPMTGGNYMALLMARRNRRCDDIIYNTLRGNALMKDGSTVALPAQQKIAHGGTGFTKAKLVGIRKLFRRNETDNYAGEEMHIVYDDEMLEDVLSDTTLTSADFMSVKMLQEGNVANKWMGFNWIPYNGIEAAGGVKYGVAWCKSAVYFGKGYEEGKVSARPDKKDATQVSMAASYGAGREAEKKVVEFAFQY